MTQEKTYGANEFINKVNELMGNKYSKELVTLQGDTTTLQHTKIQSLILLEILEELRRIGKPQLIYSSPVDKPVEISKGVPSASSKS